MIPGSSLNIGVNVLLDPRGLGFKSFTWSNGELFASNGSSVLCSRYLVDRKSWMVQWIIQWGLKPDEGITAIAVQHGLIFAGTNQGRLYCLYPNETSNWNFVEGQMSHCQIDRMSLEWPYLAFNIDRGAGAIKISEDGQGCDIFKFPLPEGDTRSFLRHLRGELLGTQVLAKINKDGFSCDYHCGANVRECSWSTRGQTQIHHITSDGILLVENCGKLRLVQAITHKTVLLADEINFEDGRAAAVAVDGDALVLAILYWNRLLVWAYTDADWYPKCIHLGSSLPKARYNLQATLENNGLTVCWLQGDAAHIVSQTITGASRPRKLMRHDPALVKAASIADVHKHMVSPLYGYDGLDLFPLYGDPQLDQETRDRHLRMLEANVLPYEGRRPLREVNSLIEVEVLQFLVPHVENRVLFDIFLETILSADAIVVVRAPESDETITNRPRSLEKCGFEVAPIDANQLQFNPFQLNQLEVKRLYTTDKYDIMTDMRERGYPGTPPPWDVLIVSAKEHPERIFNRAIIASSVQPGGVETEKLISNDPVKDGPQPLKRAGKNALLLEPMDIDATDNSAGSTRNSDTDAKREKPRRMKNKNGNDGTDRGSDYGKKSQRSSRSHKPAQRSGGFQKPDRFQGLSSPRKPDGPQRSDSSQRLSTTQKPDRSQRSSGPRKPDRPQKSGSSKRSDSPQESNNGWESGSFQRSDSLQEQDNGWESDRSRTLDSSRTSDISQERNHGKELGNSKERDNGWKSDRSRESGSFQKSDSLQEQDNGWESDGSRASYSSRESYSSQTSDRSQTSDLSQTSYSSRTSDISQERNHGKELGNSKERDNGWKSDRSRESGSFQKSDSLQERDNGWKSDISQETNHGKESGNSKERDNGWKSDRSRTSGSTQETKPGSTEDASDHGPSKVKFPASPVPTKSGQISADKWPRAGGGAGGVAQPIRRIRR